MNLLTSDRFKLRYLEAADASAKYLYWLNSGVSEFILIKPESNSGLVAYIEEQLADKDVYFYGIFTLDSDEHIGNINITCRIIETGLSSPIAKLRHELQNSLIATRFP